MGVAGEDVAGIERWFVDRGLPHFVERRDSATAIWGRALPLLVVAYLLLGFNALDVREYSWRKNLGVAVFVVAVAVITWVVANILRRRPGVRPPSCHRTRRAGGVRHRPRHPVARRRSVG